MWLYLNIFLALLGAERLVYSQETLIPVGCFQFPSNDSQYSLDQKQMNVSGDSAIQCVQICRKHSHRYSGVKDPSECLCGDKFRGTPSKDCTTSCYPDTNHVCGGETAISVYETGSSVPEAPPKFTVIASSFSSMNLSWTSPILDGSSPITQYKIKAVPLSTATGKELPPLREWDFNKKVNNALIFGLHPATQYSLEIRACNKIGMGVPKEIIGWTSISYPPIPMQPEIMSRTPSTITVKVHPVSSESGPITSYQIVVVDESISVVMDPSLLTNFNNATEIGLPYYIAASFDAGNFDTVFTAGDGREYGGYFNAPLKPNIDYHILLGAVSTLNKTLASYSVSDHAQHMNSDLHHHEHEGLYTRSNKVADKVADHHHGEGDESDHSGGGMMIALIVSISILAFLVVIALIFYIGLRVFLQAPKRPELQELTVNSYDNRGLTSDGITHFLPDEDLPDHYSRLKQKVAVMAPSDLSIVGDVGIGTFGAIKKGMVQSSSAVHSCNQTNSPALVHHILDSALDTPKKAAMLRSLGQHVTVAQHKHVVALLGLVEEVTAVSVVFECYTQTLKQQLTEARALTHFPVYADKHRRFSTVSEQQIYTILAGVARGLQWLRCCGVAHGAVCARNIVLVDGSVPKISGFGLLHYTNEMYVPDYRRWMARELLSHSAQDRGTPHTNGYANHAIDEIPNSISSLQGDIWSYGVLMWECVSLGGTPYPELRGDELTGRVQTGTRLPKPDFVGNDLYQIMLDCWQLDPGERPGLPQLEAQMNQLMGEGSHLLFSTYPGFQYQLYAPHLEFME